MRRIRMSRTTRLAISVAVAVGVTWLWTNQNQPQPVLNPNDNPPVAEQDGEQVLPLIHRTKEEADERIFESAGSKERMFDVAMLKVGETKKFDRGTGMWLYNSSGNPINCKVQWGDGKMLTQKGKEEHELPIYADLALTVPWNPPNEAITVTRTK